MKGKKRYPARRILALLLAVLLAVNIIPGGIYPAMAADPYNIKVTFSFPNGIGDKVTGVSDVKIAIKDSSLQEVSVADTAGEANFQGAAGDYTYEISSDKYGKPVTGTFNVAAPASGTDVTCPVAVTEKFDNVADQFTYVAVSGTVTNNNAPLSGISVTGYYGTIGGDQAFTCVTGADGTYTGHADINRTIVIRAEDSAGKFITKDSTVEVKTSEITDQDFALDIVQYNIQVLSNNDQIFGSLAIESDGQQTTGAQAAVNHGSSAKIILTETAAAAGRYNLQYKVTELRGGVQTEGQPQSAEATGGQAVITVPDITCDIQITLSFTTKLSIENLTYTTKGMGSNWINDEVEITGTVINAEDQFEVKVVNPANLTTIIQSSSEVGFRFPFSGIEKDIIKENYRIILKDTATNLEIMYPEETEDPIPVWIDKIPPVFKNEVIRTGKDEIQWYEDTAKSIYWAKAGFTYQVSASDVDKNNQDSDESGLKAESFKVNNAEADAGQIGADGKTVTVTVGGEQGKTIPTVTDTIDVKDIAGNDAQTMQVKYGIDNAPPVVKESDLTEATGLTQSKKDNKWYWNGSEEIKIKVKEPEDEGCGLQNYNYYIVDKGSVMVVKEYKNLVWADQKTITINKEDIKGLAYGNNYEIQVSAQDNLGNVSDKTTICSFAMDNQAPKISYEFETSLFEKLKVKLGKLFGIYTNETVKVKVTASDDGVGFIEKKGDKDKIFTNLQYNGMEIEPIKNTEKVGDDKNNNQNTVATIEYEISIDSHNGLWAPIKVNASDALGNTYGSGKSGDGIIATAGKKDSNSNLTDFNGEIKIMLENEKPLIGTPYKMAENGTGKSYVDVDNSRLWFSAGTMITYTFKVSDPEKAGKLASGLYNISCKVNENDHHFAIKSNGTDDKLGEEGLNKDEDGADRMKSCTVTVVLTEQDSKLNTGECKLELSVCDNAGNAADPYEDTVYFDVDAPVINGFGFTPADTDGRDKAGNDVSVATKTNYGYFFNKSTMVDVDVTDKIKASGNPGSGIAQVQYRLAAAEDSVIPSKDWTDISPENGKYGFPIEENFKGQFYVRAMDHVAQKSKGYDADGTSPRGLVVESQDRHNKVTKAAITLSDTPYTDAAGHRLYAGTAVADILVQNTFAGIRNALYTRTGRESAAEFAGNIDEQGGAAQTGGFALTNDSNLVTALNLRDPINFGENTEVSDILLNLSAVCNAGHGADSAPQETISYDTWAPRLEITWDNNDVRNEKYYKADRTATIVVTERNFDESKCEFITTGPTPSISGWSHNGDVHTAAVSYSADGDYTFTFRVADRAGHMTDYGRTDEFTIDKTVPVIAVSYDNNSAANGHYYKESRTASLTITEHNFRASEVSTTMSANDNGAGISAPGVNGWNSSGDTNSASVSYSFDGEFTFGMTYEDLAGNQAQPYGEDHFIVDLKDPELEIYDIQDQSANNDMVAPGVRYSDTNVNGDGVTISLIGANTGEYSLDGNKSVGQNGVDLKLNDFPREKEVDDLYTMKAHVEDLSGRMAEKEIMFSVNRFGSVYVLDKDTQKLVEDNDGYTNKEQKVGIREINVDLLEAKDVSVSRDGEMEKLKDGKNYTVSQSGGEDTWKEYYYRLDKENFEEEGTYNVAVFSTDRAANTQDNKNNKRNEECNVEFVIDKTAPSTVVSGIENVGRYREPERTVYVDAKDNILLNRIVADVDGDITEFFPEDLKGSSGSVEFEIPSADKWQNIKVYSIDKAGNTDEKETNPMRVIVTSNLFVQFTHNTPLLAGSIALVVLAAGGLAWFFGFRKKGSRKEQSL